MRINFPPLVGGIKGGGEVATQPLRLSAEEAIVMASPPLPASPLAGEEHMRINDYNVKD